jgi:hypothetical protein
MGTRADPLLVGQTIVFGRLPGCAAAAYGSHPEGESAEQLQVAAIKRCFGSLGIRVCRFWV